MLCVTVPSLPRGAMIEWQTVLSTASTEDLSMLMTAYGKSLIIVTYVYKIYPNLKYLQW
jgi:hypothetical protein